MITLKKFNYFNFEKVSIILVLIFPFFLVSGPFLSDLAVFMLSIYFFLNYSKFKFNGLIIFLFIFYLTILITNIFSFDLLISYEKTIPYIRFLLFVFVFSYLFEKYESYQKYFWDLYKVANFSSCSFYNRIDSFIRVFRSLWFDS